VSITSLDIKFRQSQRMTDFADGGGRMSAVEIVDGDMNNVFGDRSDLDAILGRVSLRKMFLHVDTLNTDTYLGAFVFLTDPPQDPLVTVTLFNTASATDERTAARNYVEAYRTKGPRTQYVLYGTHLAGQMTLQVHCREETASPDIGDVFCLSVEASGYPEAEQYIRVQEVASRITTTFEDGQGTFQRDVLIIQITTPLAQEFVGQEEPQRITGANPPPTRIRSTSVANAARYYAAKPTTAEAELGDLHVNVGNPYVAIVPSSQAETPLVDQLGGLGTLAFVRSSDTGALTFSGSLTAAANVNVSRYLGSPFARRTLYITAPGGIELRDNGAGELVATDPLNTGWSGFADYATGAFGLARDIGFSGTVSAVATAAGAITEQAYSIPIMVTPATRNLSYVYQLPGSPAPGTVALDYRALGKWIRLSDNGAGVLTGQAGEGGGTINYASGSVAVTLGALPDVDSAVILLWGIDLRARDSHGELTIPTPQYRQQLDHGGIEADSLTMSWLSGGVAKSATCSAAGAITGDATGTLDPIAGVVLFTTSAVADAGYTYSYDYLDPADVHSETFTPTPASGVITVALANAPAAPNTVRARWVNGSNLTPRVFREFRANDDGLGEWDHGWPGAINYTTGDITLGVE